MQPSEDETAVRPTRKHPRHGLIEPKDFPVVVFLTVCSKDRRQWLGGAEVHRSLHTIWSKAQAWRVGRYVIMPDHLHLFCTLGKPELELDAWVRYWKSQFSRSCRVSDRRWQSDHWDYRIRNWDQYTEKWEYVRHNAVRKNLVARPDDWPYQGQVFELY